MFSLGWRQLSIPGCHSQSPCGCRTPGRAIAEGIWALGNSKSGELLTSGFQRPGPSALSMTSPDQIAYLCQPIKGVWACSSQKVEQALCERPWPTRQLRGHSQLHKPHMELPTPSQAQPPAGTCRCMCGCASGHLLEGISALASQTSRMLGDLCARRCFRADLHHPKA